MLWHMLILPPQKSMTYMVPLRDNVELTHILLASELIYSIKRYNYNLVNLSVLHSVLDVYQVY